MFKENKFIFKKKGPSGPSSSPENNEENETVTNVNKLLAFSDQVADDMFKTSEEVEKFEEIIDTTLETAALKLKIITAKTPQQIEEALEDHIPKIIRSLRKELKYKDGLDQFVALLKESLADSFKFVYEKPDDDTPYYPIVIPDCGFDPNQKSDILIWVPKS